ncbi:hypothetical protein C3Z06_09060 [Cupriavidus metallidurans]|nr:hypothetical protein C3Z06_09060 [Cupriavidus metallidurans]
MLVNVFLAIGVFAYIKIVCHAEFPGLKMRLMICRPGVITVLNRRQFTQNADDKFALISS